MKRLISIIIFLFLVFQIYAQGCMEASSDEGVNVVGYLQSQFEYQFNEEDNENKFTFNRARMGLLGNIPYDFSYYIMYEFSPNKDGAPYLLDGFITYSRLAPWVSFSLGQFKSPFSLELNTPCQGLHTIKRSIVVTQLANPDRDRGILLSGKYNKFLKYGLAFTNGRGRDKEEDNQNKAISGRIVVTPVEYLSFGGGYRSWHDPNRDDTGEIDPDADDDERTRYAADMEFKHENILIQGEYISGEDVGSSPEYSG